MTPPTVGGVRLWMFGGLRAERDGRGVDLGRPRQRFVLAVLAICSGTHVGDYLGFPATNRSFKCEMLSIERFERGQVVERWEQVDNATVMQQLAG